MTEEEQLKELTKLENRKLSSYQCGWCEHDISKVGWDAIYDRCTIIERVIRRRKILKEIRSAVLPK